MYQIPVEIKASKINGQGVFALSLIPKGTLVWIFDENHDKTLVKEDFDKLSPEEQLALRRVAYLSATTGRWVYPPENDPALYTNHSPDNNISVAFDKNLSQEPFFVANQDISIGEEITNNYHEFDSLASQSKQTWLQ
ncbi:MAG: hypothetical protein RLZZ360_683 [Candidatus Parcubacteria bacterium]|jgi:SET domain-containing protein